MPALRTALPTALALTLLLAACGGGGGGDPVATGPDPASAAPPATDTRGPAAAVGGAADGAGPTLAQRVAAATATAGSAANACVQVRPFYWEIGDRTGPLAGGSIGRTSNGRAVTAETKMRYASASKWLYAGYVAQRRGGRLQAWDAPMLSMRSGYVHFSGCTADQTVDACLASQSNDLYEASADGKFVYGAAHMQKHASLIGLGAMNNGGLASALRKQLGDDVAIGMAQPQPAGGATGTPRVYANFLRKLSAGDLALGALLGSSAVCASPRGCPRGEALVSPAPTTELWHYSLGHWVESDPVVGDGAFSSAGAFGFYPWVSRDRSHWGMVARDTGVRATAPGDEGAGVASGRCGRLIRQAWVSGVAL